jgi:hypothetical protein
MGPGLRRDDGAFNISIYEPIAAFRSPTPSRVLARLGPVNAGKREGWMDGWPRSIPGAPIGTQTLSLVIYRGQPDRNPSFEVMDAAPPAEVP